MNHPEAPFIPRIIIVLTGKAGAGKDTFADMLCEEGDYTQLSLAFPLKLAASVITDCPISRFEDPARKNDRIPLIPQHTIRTFLQWLGTDICRNQLRDDLWAHLLIQRARRILVAGNTNIVITDCRFENEYNTVRAAFHKHIVALVEIVGPPNTTCPDHKSEQWTPQPEQTFARIQNHKRDPETLKRYVEEVHQTLTFRAAIVDELENPPKA